MTEAPRRRCGKKERHTPHHHQLRIVTGEIEDFWCDGKPPNPNLVED